MGRIILPTVASPVLSYFTTLSHKRNKFKKRKRFVEHKMCILISVQFLSETFLFLRKSDRDKIKNVNRSLCKIPVILVIF